MRKQEIEVFSDAVNGPVMRHPSRRFPGSLIQGDTLFTLCGLAESIQRRLAQHPDQELVGEVAELHQLLRDRLLSYQETLEAAGVELPYSGRIEEDA